MIGGMGGWELMILLVIVVIVFGVGRLPEVGSALGKAIRGFKEETSAAMNSDKDPKDAKVIEQ